MLSVKASGKKIAIVAILLSILAIGTAFSIAIFSSRASSCNNPPTFAQCGSRSDTITNTQATNILTQNFPFPTAFKTPPANVVPVVTLIAGTQSTSISNFEGLYSGEPVFPVVTAAFDLSAIQGDASFSTNPFTVTLTVGSPTNSGEFAVLITGAGCQLSVSCTITPVAFSVSSVTDTQGSSWTKLQSGNDGSAVPVSEIELWVAKLASTSSETITITYSNPNTDTVFAGATVSLYSGVASAGQSAIGSGSATSQTITVNGQGTFRNNDFVVGGSVLAVANNGAIACDSITAGILQTQRRVDSVNCGTNKIVNFDIEDRVWQKGLVPTFSANYGAADGNAITAVELITQAAPFWMLTSAFTELFANNNHEIASANIGKSGTLQLHLTCRFPSATSPTINFRLLSGTTVVSNLITGSASTICNGLDQASTPLSIPVGTTYPGPFLMQGDDSGGGPNLAISIEVTEAYFLFTFANFILPNIVIRSISTTGFTFQILITGVVPSTTITWTWRAEA